MTVSGRLLHFLNPAGKFEESEFYPGEKLTQLLTLTPRKDLTPLGEKFFVQEAELEKYDLEAKDFFFINIHKFFFTYLKEEGVGIISIKEYRRGFFRAVENLPLPDLFIIGILRGMLHYFGMKGSRIKEERSKEEGQRTSEYLVTWMTSNA